MKVSELLKRLEGCDPESVVVLSRDGEGNGFGILHTVDGNSVFNKAWGEVRLAKLTPQLEERGCTEEDIGLPEDGFIPAVVLWP